MIVSVGDGGSLVSWDLPSNTIRRMNIPTKVSPVCMTCCPHNKEIVAVGGKAGLILIINIKGELLLFFYSNSFELKHMYVS